MEGLSVIQNAYSWVQGEGGCHPSCVCTNLHYFFSCFWQHFCLIVSCFICKNLTLRLFKKDVFVVNTGYFSPVRPINVVVNKLFLLKDSHREKAPSNKIPALTKSTNMDIWIKLHQIKLHYIKSTLHKRFLNWNKIKK